MLNKVKASFTVALVAFVSGGLLALNGVDWTVAFGPTLGALVASAVSYGVKESLPALTSYIERWLD
jgi:hypothetical protein